MKTVKLSLSSKSIENAKKELLAYKKEIREKAQEIVFDLVVYGLDFCKAEIIRLNIPDTGHLLSQVSAGFNAGTMEGFIRVSCDYAVYVEFGTGTKGKGTPYIGEAMSKVGYKYMGGTTYVTLSDGRIGWYYPADDGTWKFTEGLPSRPFMYNTAQELRQNLNEITKEVWRK
jgi:hypothetical protein